ncbi:MAG: DUF58 domain-containing protein [Actinomycetota bacterium]|nr:DUF58 domain-containing protein [Actinomycetota bacterium]
MLLEPELLSRLERLSLATHARTAGAYPGAHRSKRLGSSVDFADWRAYVPGDDFRRIDYQIYARLDRLLVRLYEAEDEVSLQIVLDATSSMGFEDKFETGARLAGALSYLAALHGDRARVWVVDAHGIRPSPWARSRDSSIALFGWLEQIEPGGRCDLPTALKRFASAGGLRGVTVLISDLLTDEWEAVLRRLTSPGAGGALLQVLSPAEIDPQLRGDLLLVDSEAGATVEVSVSDQVLRQYRQRTQDWLRRVRETCRRRGLHYELVAPDDDLGSLLMVRLREGGLVR